MGTEDIDPVQFGKLLQSVESLTAKVDSLSTKVEHLESTLTGGKGMIAGALVAAGGLGAGLSEAIKHLFK